MKLEKFGRYEIKHKLKRGGMATVYLAHDPRFGRDVALKVMSPMFSDDDTFRGRFVREAKTVAALEHPAIVPVYDFGEEGDLLYLVMRYMAGGSLSERIAITGAFSLEATMAVLRPIAEALEHAHARGVIHRDLKPGNILFDDYGHAFLSDFGIVKLSEATATLTKSGVIGTPAYMSPEQVHGDGPIDGRSDIYTLGIILYEMLTSRKPYHADTPAKLMMSHVLNPVPNILEARPDLPTQCAHIIQRTLAKKADERFGHATAVTIALNQVVTGTHTTPAELKFRPEPSATPEAVSIFDTETMSVAGDEETTASVSHPDDNTATISVASNKVVPEAATAVPEDLPTIPTNPTPASPIVTAEPTLKKTQTNWLRWGSIIGIILLLIMSCGIGFPYLTAFLGMTEIVEPTPTIPPAPTLVSTTDPLIIPTFTVQPTSTPTPAPILTPTPESVTLDGFAVTSIGTPLTLTRIGFGENVVLLIGGLHSGFAPASVTIAEQMIAYYQEEPSRIPADISLYILPNLNPDSLDAPGALEGRLNSNGVDLNRNWDCRWTANPLWRGETVNGGGGTAPFSENEVNVVRNFVVTQSPKVVIFWGAQSVDGFVSGGACDDESDVSRDLATLYGQAANYNIGDFEAITDQLLNGDATNWLDQQGIPAMTVLLPTYDNSDFENNQTAVDAILTAISEENN